MEFTHEKFKLCLVRKGLNQASFAELLGVKQPTVSVYMTGKKKASYKQIERFAKALGVETQEICEDSPEDQQQGLTKIEIPTSMNPANVEDKFKNITDVELVLYLQNMKTTRLQSIIYAAVSGKVNQS